MFTFNAFCAPQLYPFSESSSTFIMTPPRTVMVAILQPTAQQAKALMQ